MNKMEIWISPEQAASVSKGSVITLAVDGKEQVGKGYLISGYGVVVTAEGHSDDPAEPPAADDTSAMNLSGNHESPPIQSFAAPPVQKESSDEPEPAVDTPAPAEDQEPSEPSPKSAVQDEKKSALAFGERGPQLINGEETPTEQIVDEAPKEDPPSKAPINRKVIDNINDLYDALAKMDISQVEAAQNVDNMTHEQRRELAVELEKSGKIGCGFSAFVKNTSGGQLVLSDIDVRIRHGDSYNLGRVSPARLMDSVELFEAVNMKLLEFIDADTAIALNNATSRRLAMIEEGLNSVDVYDNSDDVYDEINNGGDHGDEYEYSDDPMPRMAGTANRRQSNNPVDNRFRRGINSAGKTSRSDSAAVEAPPRFKGIRGENILDGGDKYEFDMIFEGMDQRESQIASNPDIDFVGGEHPTREQPAVKTGRTHTTVGRK